MRNRRRHLVIRANLASELDGRPRHARGAPHTAVEHSSDDQTAGTRPGTWQSGVSTESIRRVRASVDVRMSDDASTVSVEWYLAGLETTVAASAVLWALVLAPLAFGDPAWVADASAPSTEMRDVSRGVTLPTVFGIAFVAVCAVGHGWLYVNYPRLLDR